MADRTRLTVRFVEASGGLRVRYLDRGGLTAAQLPEDTRLSVPARLDGVVAALAKGDFEGIAHHINGTGRRVVGDALYRLLFPDDGVASALFRELSGSFAQGPVNPLRCGLRVCVEGPSNLAGLPWRLTAWNDRPLVLPPSSWTFELTLPDTRPPSPELARPAVLLLVAPNNGPPEGPQHVRLVQARLAQSQPAYHSDAFVRFASTRDELQRELQQGPQVVYYFGHGTLHRGAPALLLDGDAGPVRVTAADVLSWTGGASPRAMFFNGCGTGDGGWASLGHQLVAQVPAVLTQLTSAWSAPAAEIGLSWLVRLLVHDLAPVEAIHHAPEETQMGEPHWWTTTVHAAYDGWRRRGNEEQHVWHDERPIADRLDRLPQRERLRFRLDELLKPSRRVLAAVGVGARDPDMHPERLGELLHGDLATERCEQIVLNRCRVELPDVRNPAARTMESAIRHALDAPPNARLADFLQHRAPRGGDGRVPVLWLDFGTLGEGRGSLKPGEITAWLGVCDSVLAASCPDTMRVIAFLCVDVKNPAAVERDVVDYATDCGARIICAALPPLGHVKYEELNDLMRSPAGPGCPEGLRRKATRALFERCSEKGRETANYACLCREIERAEAIGWAGYLHEATELVEEAEEV